MSLMQREPCPGGGDGCGGKDHRAADCWYAGKPGKDGKGKGKDAKGKGKDAKGKGKGDKGKDAKGKGKGKDAKGKAFKGQGGQGGWWSGSDS